MENPLSLSIRIIELHINNEHLEGKKLKVMIRSSENERTNYTMKIDGKYILKGYKPARFNVKSQSSSSIFVDVKRSRFIVKDELIGNVQLPLNWFPINHIVREWYPVKGVSNVQDDVMILLDIHIDNRGALPFMAPFASLRVLPTWTRPLLTENSDFPVIPSIVYITMNDYQKTLQPERGTGENPIPPYVQYSQPFPQINFPVQSNNINTQFPNQQVDVSQPDIPLPTTIPVEVQNAANDDLSNDKELIESHQVPSQTIVNVSYPNVNEHSSEFVPAGPITINNCTVHIQPKQIDNFNN
ncbi:hypothetical protein TRFO_36343 [Tritrichomonas foetus]|uniref:Uncharacterized protein n=1 Tax=Tritrichomonas foetus TaxID=1144522 RepID=A0A1J4JE49_9EUKA|nr:hypothetical protein TRFO_36343 [Tritrichomonas foetus]|eukprot:OHS97478.1 hypothetical protein TRFO_36343 [Tritrichomonas foetus]